MNIEQWLSRFDNAWKNHDITGVMELFTDDVKYWETPHLLLETKDVLKKEWASIKYQENINHQTNVFCSSPDNKHAVLWKLSYKKDNKIVESAGTYLIGLDNSGKCNFFHYTSQPK